jgi:O-antigen ligase
MIVAGCIASIYGSAKVIFGFEERASSSTSGYSTLGMFLAVIISFTLWLGKSKELFPSRRLWSLSLLIMGGGLLLTLNRTHWGVVGVIFLIVGLLREKIALLVTLGFSGLAIIFISSISNRFYQMIHFLEYTSGRNVIWQGALMKITERPIFGFGPRTFEQIFPLRNQLEDKLIASWHNDFLQIYMESGLFALIAFLWIIATIYYYGFKIAQLKELDIFYKEITIAILLGMSAFFLTGLVGGFIIDPITSLLFRFLLAILALISTKAAKKTTSG